VPKKSDFLEKSDFSNRAQGAQEILEKSDFSNRVPKHAQKMKNKSGAQEILFFGKIGFLFKKQNKWSGYWSDLALEIKSVIKATTATNSVAKATILSTVTICAFADRKISEPRLVTFR
jgi:hypothetical protein